MNALIFGALWLFIFAVPWQNVIIIPGMAIVTRLTGLLAAAMALFAVVVSGRARRWHPFHVFAFLFVAWIGCSLLFFNNKWLQIPSKYLTFVQLFVVLWVVWQVAPTRKHQLRLLAAYVMGAYVAALDTLVLYRKEAAVLKRFAAGNADPNDLAMTLALALPMAWYLGMTNREPWLRFLSRLYIPIGLLAIGLTGSRGGMIATIVALSLVPLTLTRLSPGRRAIAIGLIVISGAIAVIYVPQTLIERLSTTTQEVEGGRIGGRFKLWKAGLQAFVRRPVVGYGPSSFPRVSQNYLVTKSQVAHNSFVSVLVEEGLVGLILFTMMFVVVFFAIQGLPTMERRYSLVLLATVFVAALPLTWEDAKPVWVVLALLLGLARATDNWKYAAARPPRHVLQRSPRERVILGPAARSYERPAPGAQADPAT
jgi:O-antigen ligase